MSALSVGLRKEGLGAVVDTFDELQNKVAALIPGVPTATPPTSLPSSPAEVASSNYANSGSPKPEHQNPIEVVADNAVTDIGTCAKTVVENAVNAKFPIGTKFTDAAVDALANFLEQAAIHFINNAIEHI